MPEGPSILCLSSHMHRLERHGAFTAPVCLWCGSCLELSQETVYLGLLSLQAEVGSGLLLHWASYAGSWRSFKRLGRTEVRKTYKTAVFLLAYEIMNFIMTFSYVHTLCFLICTLSHYSPVLPAPFPWVPSFRQVILLLSCHMGR